LAITLPVIWPLLCLSFGHYFACPLAITLPVFWPLLCLSFDHYFACLLAITLSVFWPLLCLSFDQRLLITPFVSSKHFFNYVDFQSIDFERIW
jgi:hypothetical protein